MNWAGGFTDLNAAASLFASGGVPSVVRVSGFGGAQSVRLEHVWVKAYVDYIPSQGAVNKEGDTWVELDGSYKNLYSPNLIDFKAFVSIPSDFQARIQATAIISASTHQVSGLDYNYLQSVTTVDENNISSQINQNYSNIKFSSIIGENSIIGYNSELIDQSQIYDILSYSGELSTLPEFYYHKTRIQLMDDTGNLLIDTTLKTSEETSCNIVIGYEPYNSNEQAALDSYINNNKNQNMIPVGVIDMMVYIRYNNSKFLSNVRVPVGGIHNLKLSFSAPNSLGDQTIQRSLDVGETYVMCLNPEGVSREQLASIGSRFQSIANSAAFGVDFSPDFEEIQTLILESIIMGYFSQVDLANKISDNVSNIKTVRYPSIGSSFLDISASRAFGSGYITINGIKMDIYRDYLISVAKNGDVNNLNKQRFATGMIGSQLEASLPKYFIGIVSNGSYWLSAANSLAIAQESGDTMVIITKDNLSLVRNQLTLDLMDINAIENAINEGDRVFIHQNLLVNKFGSTYTGYLKYNSELGTYSYIISGYNGSTEEQCDSGLVPSIDLSDLRFIEKGIFGIASDAVNEFENNVVMRQKSYETFDRLSKIIIKLIDGDFDVYKALGVPDNAKPLLGLAVLFSILNTLNDGGADVEPVFGLSVAADTAYRGAALMLGRIAEIDAASQGIILTPGCIASRLTKAL
jgi:hypothetical protein